MLEKNSNSNNEMVAYYIDGVPIPKGFSYVEGTKETYIVIKNKTDVFDITIPEYNFEMSWNLGNSTTWAIDSESVNEIGCIHTAQGLEFDYVGVIIGNDLRYENNKVVADVTERAKTDQSIKGIYKIYQQDFKKAEKIADEIIKNTYSTLMTRGQKG